MHFTKFYVSYTEKGLHIVTSTKYKPMVKKRQFTEEERIQLAKEYALRNVTLEDIKSRYGISLSKGLIYSWMKKYRISKCESKKRVPLHANPKKDARMQDQQISSEKSPDTDALLSRISQLEQALKWEQMRTHALETLIDVAEENGLKVRKKSGAKQ